MKIFVHSEKPKGIPSFEGREKEVKNLEKYLAGGMNYSERRRFEIKNELEKLNKYIN